MMSKEKKDKLELITNTKKTPTKKRTIIRRRKKGKRKLYFNDETQLAIVLYQKSIDKNEKDNLYKFKILPAFEKLVENLINIHKFTSLHDSYNDLKHDCVTFLFETIGKFDSTRGTKAFSYFNVVAKNWLIIRTKNKITKIRRNISMDNPELLSSTETRIIEEYYAIEAQDDALERRDMAQAIIKSLYDIRNIVKTENELACVNSIITIFENIDELDLLNKSSILLYIREMTNLSPKQLTTAMQTIKKHYTKLKSVNEFELNIFDLK